MLWRWYRSMLAKHPWKTQILSGGVLCASGDAISQFVAERKHISDYKPARTARFFGLGSCYIAPITQTWLIFLERTVTVGSPMVLPLKRLFCDQTMFSPIFNASLLIVLRLIEGKGLEKAVELWKRDFLHIYTTNLKIWPFVQLVNFYLIPLNYRIIVMQCVALFWNAFVAFTTQKATQTNSSSEREIAIAQ